jgi:hypothetical protein
LTSSPRQAVVTVDTEADGGWDYHASSRVTVENLNRLPRFQALCERYGMKPTYLCTWEVVRDESFAEIVRWQDAGRAEIGTHLHPWTSPPFATPGARDFDPAEYPGYPLELPLDHFRAKLERLTALIAEKSGRAPTSYRAGRWGMAAAHVPILLDCGYIVDCSVTPTVDRRYLKGVRAPGPDYSTAPLVPYRLSERDLCTPGTSALLEVPVTIVQPRALLRSSSLAQKAYRLLKRLRGAGTLNRIVRTEPIWLRPYPDHDAASLRKVIAVADELGLPVLEMMLHSSELLPGGSESFLTEASVEKLFVMTEAAFATMQEQGIAGVTLSDYARAYMARPAPPLAA